MRVVTYVRTMNWKNTGPTGQYNKNSRVSWTNTFSSINYEQQSFQFRVIHNFCTTYTKQPVVRRYAADKTIVDGEV